MASANQLGLWEQRQPSNEEAVDCAECREGRKPCGAGPAECPAQEVATGPLCVTEPRTVKGALYQLLVDADRRGLWLTIPAMERELKRRGFNCLQTSISARLRELPRDAPTGYSARVSGRVREGTVRLWEYRLGVHR